VGLFQANPHNLKEPPLADRNFFRNHMSLETDVVHLYARITIGASGAVSSSSGLGIASVVKQASAGQYTVTLSDRYNQLLHANVTVISAVDAAQTVGTAYRIQSEAVNSATPNLIIQASDTATGADANPTSGDILLLKIELRNSSLSNT